MRRFLPKASLVSFLASMSLLAASNVQADQVGYYSTDLDDAVQSVKNNPINSNRVGTRWYGRSTSNSFTLPKLENTEMEQEVVEGAMGPTAAGEAAAADAQQPVKDLALDRKNQKSAFDTTDSETARTKLSSTKVQAPVDTTLILNNNASTDSTEYGKNNASQYGRTNIQDIRGGTIQRSYLTPSP